MKIVSATINRIIIREITNLGFKDVTYKNTE